jgi:hypothetical protein
MPPISLVVCLHGERDLLERLLERAGGCYDDLVVVHDGPCAGPADSPSAPPAGLASDFSLPAASAAAASFWIEKTGTPAPSSLHELTARYGGRFFEGPRCRQQEPHWPFAWTRARHDWILRLDADEFPSAPLADWLREFRARPQPPGSEEPAGYTCIWPFWDGRRSVSDQWPDSRLFLFDRRKVRFFGMAEQTPVAEGSVLPLPLVLCHQPRRKSYGFRNILFRRQAYRWRSVIVRSVAGSPMDLPRWRWSSHEWPDPWRRLRSRPLAYAIRSLLLMPVHTAKALVRSGIFPRIGILFQSAIHHFMLGIQFRAERSRNTQTRR